LDPVMLGLISMGVGGAVKTVGGLFGGGNQADTMRKEASLKLSTLEENMRRTEGQQTQVLSSTKARMAGTGFSTESGSFTDYIQTMATEFDKQNEFTYEAGRKTYDLMREGANTTMAGSLVGGAGDLLGTAGNMFNLSKLGGLGA
jgi:hypothetical protein